MWKTRKTSISPSSAKAVTERVVAYGALESIAHMSEGRIPLTQKKRRSITMDSIIGWVMIIVAGLLILWGNR